MIVKRVEIWRVGRPFVFADEVGSVLLQPFLRLTSGVSGRTVLLEDEGGGSYIVAVLDQLWQQIGHVVLCIDLGFFCNEMQPSFSSVADPCRDHHARGKSCSLH